jgi:hypothetical protein
LPLTSASNQVQLEVTNGISVATIDIDYLPKAGWGVQEITDGVIIKGSAFEDRVGGAPSNTSQIYYPTADDTDFSSTGIFTSNSLDSTIEGRIYDATAKEWEVLTVNTPAPASTDNTIPVLTAVPATTTHNLTVGDSFTPPVVTVADTDANGDAVTATVTPTIADSRNGQGVGAVTYTYNYTDGTNQATPIVVTVNYAAVQPTTSALNFTLTGIPDGTHSLRVLNTINNALSFTQNVDFSNGAASLTRDWAVGTTYEYYVVDGEDFGLSISGVTV